MRDNEIAQAARASDEGDAELGAISAVIKVLMPLSAAAKRRVIAFVVDRYGLAAAAQSPKTPGTAAEASADSGEYAPLPVYKHLAQLANRVRPSTDIERALIASYWVQEVEGSSPFSSSEVNARLKEISSGLTHIAESMATLQARSPALVIHLNKAGSSRQARKTYMVTDEGIAAVQSAIRAGGFTKSSEKEIAT